MVENEDEYVEFLITRDNLQENSARSYVSYLRKVSKCLNMAIDSSTVSSEEDVKTISKRLSETDTPNDYKNNLVSALGGYLRYVSEADSVFVSPDEIANPDKYAEGAKKKITVNAFERDVRARNKCIEIHGTDCTICGMNFEEMYGPVGIGYIHVHHIKPLSEVTESYSVNPETDLIPVCPNCHVMLHRFQDDMTIEALKAAYCERKGVQQSTVFGRLCRKFLGTPYATPPIE